MLKIAKSICAVLLLFVGGLYFLLYNPSSNTSTTFHYNQPKQTDTVIPTSTSSPTETTKSINSSVSKDKCMDEPSLIYYANGCCSVDELSRKVRQTLLPY